MNVPLLFTFIRLLISPLIPAVLLVFLLPTASVFVRTVLSLLFVIIALTDFFDGYLARYLKQETILGKIFDPIADKMLVICTSIALVSVGELSWMWTIIISAREIFVMGVREFSGISGVHIAVQRTGKYKATLQYGYLTAIIAGYNGTPPVITIGWASALLALISAAQYARIFLKKHAIMAGLRKS